MVAPKEEVSARQQQAERRPRRVDMQKNLSELSTPELQDEISNIKRNISVLEDELRQHENNIGFFNACPDRPYDSATRVK